MDLRPLLRPRHLLATLLVGILTGATIAAASLDTERDVPASLSSPVAIPPAREGDRGVYDTWHSGRSGDPSTWGAPDATVAFAWGADELRLDGNGDRVWTTPLVLQSVRHDVEGDEVQNSTLNLRTGTMVAISQGGETVFEDLQQPSQGIPPSPSLRRTQTQVTEWFTDQTPYTGYWASVPCLRYPFQGGQIQLGTGPVDFGGCSAPLAHGYEARYVVKAVGGQAGSRDVLLEGDTVAAYDLLPGPVVRVWLREGVPYPVRVEAVDGSGDVYDVAVLREFAAGTTPLSGERPVDSSIPELTLLPPTHIGLDDSGVDHPFPLSAAFEAARTSPDHAALRDFLGSHPDAYVGYAQGVAYATSTSRSFRWQFIATDGTDSLGVDLTRRFAGPAVADMPMDALALLDATVPPEDQFDTEYSIATASGYVPLPRDQLPAVVPTVPSLFEEWRAYATPEEAAAGPNMWRFQLGADRDAAGNQMTGILVSAGRYLYDDQGGPVYTDNTPRTIHWTTSQVTHWDDFASVRLVSRSDLTSATNEVPLTPPTATPPTDPSPAPATASTVLPAKGLFELTPVEKATIGLGAVGAALLWWFAPVIKGAVAPLFSRIRDDELLAHPVRRLAHDLVGERPGIHHQDLVRRLGKGKGGAEHHLRKLVAGGLLVRKESPGYTCYFLPGQASRAAVAAAPVTKSPVAQRILDLRRLEPAITNAELARRLSVRPATIHYHVERLRAAGLLHEVPSSDGVAAA